MDSLADNLGVVRHTLAKLKKQLKAYHWAGGKVQNYIPVASKK